MSEHQTIYILFVDREIAGIYYSLETALDNMFPPMMKRPIVPELFIGHDIYHYYWENKHLAKTFICDSDINNPNKERAAVWQE